MNEDVLLEEVLALAEQDGYEPAYDFLLAQRGAWTVSYTHLRAHETGRNLVCRLLLEKKKHQT